MFDNTDPVLKAKQLAGRHAKHNGQYMSVEQRQKMADNTRVQAAKRTHCKRGHVFAIHAAVKNGVRVCVLCRRLRKRQRYHGMAGLVPAGTSTRSYGARKAWVTRRTALGPNGLTAAGRDSMSQALKERIQRRGHHMSNKTACIRGHLFTPDNTYVTRGKRICRTCRQMRFAGRPEWVTIHNARVNVKAHDAYFVITYARLRRLMIEAHPDKGHHRSSRAFVRAKKRFDTFVTIEQQWYATVYMPLPQVRGF